MTEKIIRKIFDEYQKKEAKILEDTGGIFMSGMVMGIVFSYTGVIGYLAGFSTGILVSYKYKYVTIKILNKVSLIFQTIWNRLKELDK